MQYAVGWKAIIGSWLEGNHMQLVRRQSYAVGWKAIIGSWLEGNHRPRHSRELEKPLHNCKMCVVQGQ